MAIVNTLKLYEILRPKLQDEPAKAITEVIEKSFEEYQEKQKELLATKEDLANLKAELMKEIHSIKSEIIKWMFIFWVGQIGVLTGILLAFFKK